MEQISSKCKIFGGFDRKAFLKAVLTAFFVVGILACIAGIDFMERLYGMCR